MDSEPSSLWDKTHLWFLTLVGVLIIATILWGEEKIDLQYHDVYFVTSYGSVNGVFIGYFLIIALIYYRYYRKGCYLKFGLNVNHFCFSVMLLMQLGSFLQKCQKMTKYQQNMTKHPDYDWEALGVVMSSWESSLANNLILTLGWVLLGVVMLALNIIRYGKGKPEANN